MKIECLAQGHNTLPLERLKPETSSSQAKHFTTVLQCSPLLKCVSCTNRMAKSVNPDQTAPSGAVWSGYTLFACTYIFFNVLGHYSTYQIIDDNEPAMSFLRFHFCMKKQSDWFLLFACTCPPKYLWSILYNYWLQWGRHEDYIPEKVIIQPGR